jgi:hypothetical protein
VELLISLFLLLVDEQMNSCAHLGVVRPYSYHQFGEYFVGLTHVKFKDHSTKGESAVNHRLLQLTATGLVLT